MQWAMRTRENLSGTSASRLAGAEVKLIWVKLAVESCLASGSFAAMQSCSKKRACDEWKTLS